MKKIVMLMGIASVFSALAVDDWFHLYWQVSEEYVKQYNIGSFQGAQLVGVLNDDNEIRFDTGFYAHGEGETPDHLTSVPVSTEGTDITGYQESIKSFYVEFLNYMDESTWDVIGVSNPTLYTDASVQNALASFTQGGYHAPQYGTPFSPTGYTAVPEPSSGLMILVGGALLALRRRKRA